VVPVLRKRLVGFSCFDTFHRRVSIPCALDSPTENSSPAPSSNPIWTCTSSFVDPDEHSLVPAHSILICNDSERSEFFECVSREIFFRGK